MKLKQYLLLSIMLPLSATMQASDLTTSLTAATTALSSVQTTLAGLLGVSVAGSNSIVNPNSTSQITNDASQVAYLVMFDQNSVQINPTNISLAINGFSYLPANAATVKIVNAQNQQLVGSTPVTQNNLYSLTNASNAWKITPLAAPAVYTYTNSTTIPVLFTITDNDMIYNQQVAPAGIYTLTIDPLDVITVNAHANISGISAAYDATLSYTLTLNAENELMLTSSGAGNALINKSGWPMLVSIITSDNTQGYLMVQNGSQCTPGSTTIGVIVTPAIPNSASISNPVQSCAVTNNNGQLSLQFK